MEIARKTIPIPPRASKSAEDSQVRPGLKRNDPETRCRQIVSIASRTAHHNGSHDRTRPGQGYGSRIIEVGPITNLSSTGTARAFGDIASHRERQEQSGGIGRLAAVLRGLAARLCVPICDWRNRF